MKLNTEKKDPFYDLFKNLDVNKPSLDFTKKVMDQWILERPEIIQNQIIKRRNGFIWIFAAFIILILLPVILLFYYINQQAGFSFSISPSLKLLIPHYTLLIRYSYYIAGILFLYSITDLLRYFLKREWKKPLVKL